MATISLYKNKINDMPRLIDEVKKSVTNYKSELSNLKNKALEVNKSICDLDEVISVISTSTKTQEDKIEALETFHSNCDQFITDTVKIDSDVADVVNQNKDDFYCKYSYLKPDSEKSGWEKFCDGLKKAGEWCKEHWKSIVGVVVAILAVVAIVALTVVTLGTGTAALTAILMAGAVGAIVGMAGQLIGDVISFIMTGEWTGTWEGYLGAALGGFAGGVLMILTGGNVILSCSIDSMISTFFKENLENLTGTDKRSMTEIMFDTALSGLTAAMFSKMFDFLGNKLSKNLSHITIFRRLSGKGSYSASFKMATTRLANGTYKKFTFKTIRNGVVAGLSGDFIKNIVNGFGFENGVQGGITTIVLKISELCRPSNSYEIQMPEIYVLPAGEY